MYTTTTRRVIVGRRNDEKGSKSFPFLDIFGFRQQKHLSEIVPMYKI